MGNRNTPINRGLIKAYQIPLTEVVNVLQVMGMEEIRKGKYHILNQVLYPLGNQAYLLSETDYLVSGTFCITWCNHYFFFVPILQDIYIKTIFLRLSVSSTTFFWICCWLFFVMSSIPCPKICLCFSIFGFTDYFQQKFKCFKCNHFCSSEKCHSLARENTDLHNMIGLLLLPVAKKNLLTYLLTCSDTP